MAVSRRDDVDNKDKKEVLGSKGDYVVLLSINGDHASTRDTATALRCSTWKNGNSEVDIVYVLLCDEIPSMFCSFLFRPVSRK
jgi:hypothetical protein